MLVLAASLAVDAEAARKPSASENAAVTFAVTTQVPDVSDAPARVVIRRIVVSTVRPGAGSSFVRFAAAFGFARDASNYPAGERKAIVGLHRRTGGWIMVGWAPGLRVCEEPQFFFGGRRTTILRDLGIRCP